MRGQRGTISVHALGCRRAARIFRGGGGSAYGQLSKIQTCRGVLEILDCLGLHFARSHGGERECIVVKEKVNRKRLIF